MIAQPKSKIETYGNWAVKIIAVFLGFALTISYNSSQDYKREVARLERDKVDKLIFEKYCDRKEEEKVRHDVRDADLITKINQIQVDIGIIKTEIKNLNK
jgi:predicted ATP-dependent Lon-type protease